MSGGTLVGNTTSLQGNIVDNASVVFQSSGDRDLCGRDLGLRLAHQDGVGTLILTGDNTYSGGTTIAQGTLQIGNGGATGSVAGDIQNNSALVFYRSGTYDFPGAITGPGSVTVLGGTVNFTGANGYNGPISVDQSTFTLAPGGGVGVELHDRAGGSIGGTGHHRRALGPQRRHGLAGLFAGHAHRRRQCQLRGRLDLPRRRLRQRQPRPHHRDRHGDDLRRHRPGHRAERLRDAVRDLHDPDGAGWRHRAVRVGDRELRLPDAAPHL